MTTLTYKITIEAIDCEDLEQFSLSSQNIYTQYLSQRQGWNDKYSSFRRDNDVCVCVCVLGAVCEELPGEAYLFKRKKA